jgi:2-desacetyl-2-hydroxyethyl bacteriochlorophyllide A dehydrogenase
MRSVRLFGVGDLRLHEGEVPEPGHGEIRLRVEACGLCGTDRHLFKGEFPSKPPVTLGHEFSGIIEALGAGVSGLAIGERVTGDPNNACMACDHCRAGRVNLCRNLKPVGVGRDGGFAEQVVFPAVQAHKLPLSLKPEHGAFCEPLACCLHALDVAAIRPGMSVAVLGGGVIGQIAVQLCQLAGATAILLSTRQKSRRDLAETLGATATVDAGVDDPVAAVNGPGGLVPGGVDVVLECAGVAETVAQAMRMVRSGGTVVLFGVVAQGETVAIEPFDLLFREVQVRSAFLNPFTHARAAQMVADGVLDLDALVSRRVSLADAVEAIANPPRPGEVKVLAMPG